MNQPTPNSSKCVFFRVVDSITHRFLHGPYLFPMLFRSITQHQTMAASHILFAVFLAFGLVQLGNTWSWSTEAPANEGRLECYGDDWQVIRCENGCRTTVQEFEGEWLPPQRGCREGWSPDIMPVKPN